MLSFLELVLSLKEELSAKLGPKWLEKMVEVQILIEKFESEEREDNEVKYFESFLSGNMSEEDGHRLGYESGARMAAKALKIVLNIDCELPEYPGYSN